jgi:hypothetical protein
VLWMVAHFQVYNQENLSLVLLMLSSLMIIVLLYQHGFKVRLCGDAKTETPKPHQ